MDTIGKRIEHALAFKNIKKGVLAKKVGVHASTIDNYIKNKVKNPSTLILEKIAYCLEINVDWLILNMGDMEDVNSKTLPTQSFSDLSIERKLDKIFEMLSTLKKGQDFLGEIITASTNKENN